MIPDASKSEAATFENTKLGQRVEEKIENAVARGVDHTQIITHSAPERVVEQMVRYLESKGYNVKELEGLYKVEWGDSM